MKTNDEYKWPAYHEEYSKQLRQLAAEGQEFFIKTAEFSEDGMPVYKNNLHPNWKEIYDNAVKLKPASIYECGCGAGYHLKNLHTLLPGVEISGNDLLPDQLEFAKRFSDLPYSIIERLEVLDMTKPLVSGKQYEFVFCHAVIMHLGTENARLFLLNMEKLSSKYIFLVEGENNHDNWYEFVNKTLPDWAMIREAKHIPNGILLIKKEVLLEEQKESLKKHQDQTTGHVTTSNSYLVFYQQNGEVKKNAIDVNITTAMTAKEKYKTIKEELFKIIGTNVNINVTGVYLL